MTKKAAFVLNLLINADNPLTATQLTALDDSLNINTVQYALRNLLESGYIEVADIVYSGSVLCRNYRATDKARSACVGSFVAEFHNLRKTVPLPVIFAALAEGESVGPEVIRALEVMIENKKKALGEGMSE